MTNVPINSIAIIGIANPGNSSMRRERQYVPTRRLKLSSNGQQRSGQWLSKAMEGIKKRDRHQGTKDKLAIGKVGS